MNYKLLNNYIGKSIKYREICDILGDAPQSGSKIYTQINKWKENVDIEKVSRGTYKINKIYTETDIKNIKIKGEYLKLFSSILAEVLYNTNERSIICSTMELLSMTGMVNGDYKYARYNINQASEVLKTDPTSLDLYITKSHNVLSRLMRDMLKNLSNKSLIACRDGFVLYKYNYVDGKKYMSTKFVEFGSQIESDILGIQNETLKDMNIDTVKDVYKNPYSIIKFKNINKSKCKSKFGDYDGFYTVYQITLAPEGLKEYSTHVKKEFNNKIQSKLLNSKQMEEILDLPKMVNATISLNRPYRIKEVIEEFIGGAF